MLKNFQICYQYQMLAKFLPFSLLMTVTNRSSLSLATSLSIDDADSNFLKNIYSVHQNEKIIKS